MRKSQYIKTYNHLDKDAYNLMRNCYNVTKDQLTSIVSKNRLAAYEHQKLVEKHNTVEGTYYRLTDRGAYTFERQFGDQGYYYHSESPRHDQQLADKYISLYKTYGDNLNWKNETQLIHERQDQYDTLREQGRYEDADRLMHSSVVDCVYNINSGPDVCYEVVTDSYSKVDIKAKEIYATAIKAELEMAKI